MATMLPFHVPYLSRLEANGLQPGQTVIIKGVQIGEIFNVMFLTGPNPEVSDIAFLMIANRKDRSVHFNDKRQGVFGKEEKSKDPFKEGESVDLRIRCHDNKFEIFANMKYLDEFEYRQPLNMINHIYIDGGINLQDVSWGGKYYPVPYQAGIDNGGFRAGKMLFVSGIPEKKCDQFSINLLTAENEIGFHFNPRFGKKTVVRNANNMGGQWGAEETEGKWPFSSNEVFDIQIVNEPHAIQVFVNGVHFCAFAHRADPNSFKGLRIEGDVTLMGVHVK